MSICQICESHYIFKAHRNTTKLCASCVVNRHRFTKKKALIDYKGGKCIACGYYKSINSLSFHHLDPSKKDFEISGKHCLSLDKLKREVDKCVLLCLNCHSEVHSGVLKLSSIDPSFLDPIISKRKLYYLNSIK